MMLISYIYLTLLYLMALFNSLDSTMLTHLMSSYYFIQQHSHLQYLQPTIHSFIHLFIHLAFHIIHTDVEPVIKGSMQQHLFTTQNNKIYPQ